MRLLADRPGEILPQATSGWQILLTLLLLLLPLALTPAIPSVDFHGHVVRYDILATGGSSPALAESYRAAWAFLPNLGLDLIGTALLKLLSPLAGATVIAVIMLVAPLAGTLALARAVHGRIPLHSLLLGGVLVYSHIAVWGFANFLFGIGLGLAALGLWLALDGRPRLQLATAIGIAPLLLIVHAFAFALWGMVLALVELAAVASARPPRLRDLLVRGGRLAAVAALPIGLFLLSRTAGAAEEMTGLVDRVAGYGERGELWRRLVAEALGRIDMTLRVADSGFVAADRVLGLLLWVGLVGAFVTGVLRLDPRLRFAVPVVAALVVLMPPSLFRVAYVDDRIPLLLLALIAAGTSLRPSVPAARPFLVALATLFVVRLMLVSAGHAQAGLMYRDFVARVSGLDTGATAILLPLEGAGRDGLLPLCSPLPRLLAFANGTAVPTWAYRSQQPIRMQGPMAAAMAAKNRIDAERARAGPRDPQQHLADLFANGFDTVIVCRRGSVLPPPAGTRLLAQGPHWSLYRAQPGGS